MSPKLSNLIETLVLEVGEDLLLPLLHALQHRDATSAVLAARVIAETDSGIAGLHALRMRL